MKIRLKRGEQKKLIYSAKRDLTWKQLAKMLEVSQPYLAGDLKREKILLSEKLYRKLCRLSKANFDGSIIEKLKDNWGKSKGGFNSKGSTIKILKPKFSSELAEFVGAVLGDGHVCFHKSKKFNRRLGTYCVRIAGDLQKDRDYHINYLKPLCKNIFQVDAKEIVNDHERFLNIASKELVNFFISMEINPGDKIRNQSTIPKWILKNELFLRACLRGLIDTDGSIFRMSNQDPNLLRINFTNHNLTLLRDTWKAFIKLKFHPSKIINKRQFYISRQSEIEKYLREIGFSNQKHIKRLQEFKNSPVV